MMNISDGLTDALQTKTLTQDSHNTMSAGSH